MEPATFGGPAPDPATSGTADPAVRPILVLVAGKDPFDEPGAGHSSYVRAHARAAVAAGFDPQILCVGSSDRTEVVDFGTIRRYRTPFRPIRQLMIPGHARVLARGLVDIAGDGDEPVLAHAFGVWGAGAVDGVRRLRAGGRTAHVAISSYTTYKVEHDSLVRGARGEPWSARARYRMQALWVAAVVERWERRAYRSADRVWANYESVRTLIHERHGDDVAVDLIPYGPESAFVPLPPAPVRPTDSSDPSAPPVPPDPAVPAGASGPVGWVDPVGARDAADPVVSSSGGALIVAISRHHSRKGVDVLIEALDVLHRQGVGFHAVLVGAGPLLEAHRRRVAALGLDDVVALPGRIESVDDVLARADLFVLPSREEQSGALALLEAQRLGIAVVASAVDGIPEDVTDGETGLLVPPGDPVALAAALRSLLDDPTRRAAIADAGRRRFADRFAAEPFVAGLVAAYATLGIAPPPPS